VTTPVPIGSPAVANTMGIVDVACLAASTGGVLCVRMTSTFRRANSAAISAKRSLRFRPAVLDRDRAALGPAELASRRTKGAVYWRCAVAVLEPKNPMVGSFADCCARAASGQATTELVSAMNSRRFIRSPHRRGIR